MDDALAIFKRHLASSGSRLTPTRERLLRAVCRQRRAFGPEDIIHEARLAGDCVSRATVYRNLPHLEAAGIIGRRAGKEGWVLLRSPSRDGELICVRCGARLAVSLHPVVAAAEQVCAARGFSMTTPLSRLHGLCRHCHAAADLS
ncbi:MAG: transcriptional repressor [Myxococcales bacterium]|nr:transcriptional repressor [Myxococcales bacterium]